MCELGLVSSYVLSFRTLDSFEAVIVAVHLDDGSVFRGEVVPLPGYANETVASVLDSLHDWLPSLKGLAMSDARAWLGERVNRVPFAASAVLGALDQALIDYPRRHTRGRVPLVFPLASIANEFEADVLRALQQGYRTLKVKVGFGLDQDLAAVSELQRILPMGVSVRFDANGAFALDGAPEFCATVHRLLGESVEFIEQPFSVDAWDDTAALAARSEVPLMLDESIRKIEDLDRGARAGAQMIKLKICKQGSILRVLHYAQRARRLGLGVVLGNGVATDLSNKLELWMAARHPTLFHGASEANGFLKLREPVQQSTLRFDAGNAIW